ncbi:MAG: lamin tail domain-containing protein, partial [Bacteroidota bacterium]
FIEAQPKPGYEFSHWNTADITFQENLISTGDEWKYLDSVVVYPEGWADTGFIDTNWLVGPSQLGYGDGDESTFLDYGPDANNKRTTYLFRKNINIENPELFEELLLEILVDDGAVLYINGREYTRIYMNNGTVTPQTFATRATDMENSFHRFEIQSSWFVEGENTIAVEVHQISLTSSDISFDMKLHGLKRIASSGEQFSTQKILQGNVEAHLSISPVFTKKAVVKDIIINEVSLAEESFRDNMGEPSDFIELYNQGNDTADLGGLFITDDILLMNKHQFPENAVDELSIPPKEYLVLFADNQPEQGIRHVSFKLDKDGECVILSQQFGNEYVILDSLSFEFLERGYSYGLRLSGDEFIYMSKPTPGGVNNEASEVKTVSTEYARINNKIKVYPNPARNRLFIDLSNNTGHGEVRLELMNVQGQMLKQIPASEKSLIEIELDGFAPGIYLLKVTNADNQEIYRIVRGH